MNSDLSIQPLQLTDCPAVAQIHLRAFPESALTYMGLEAVRRYYAWQITGPHDCFAAGAFREEVLVGFIFAGVFRGALSGFVSKNRWFLAGRVLTHPWLAFNSIFMDRLRLGLRVLRPKKAVVSPAATASPPRPFGVLAIAVDPRVQRSGAGTLLMEAAEKAALASGFHSMGLSVHPTNTQAVRFYEKLGWQRVLGKTIWNGSMVKPIGGQS